MSDAIDKKYADNVARIAALFDDKVTMSDRIEQLERELSISRMAQVVMDNTVDALTKADDRIEALTAERDLADRGWKEAIELTRQARLQYSDEKARAENAEADNARLRAALECLLIEYDYAEIAQAEPPSLTAAVFSARAALTGKADQAVAGAALEEIGQLQARVEDQAREIADLTRQLQGQPRRPQDVARALDCVCGMGFGPCKDPKCKAPILTGKEPSHE